MPMRATRSATFTPGRVFRPRRARFLRGSVTGDPAKVAPSTKPAGGAGAPSADGSDWASGLLRARGVHGLDVLQREVRGQRKEARLQHVRLPLLGGHGGQEPPPPR